MGTLDKLILMGSLSLLGCGVEIKDVKYKIEPSLYPNNWTHPYKDYEDYLKHIYNEDGSLNLYEILVRY